MRVGFPLFPEQASTVAEQVDALYYFLVGVSLFFASLIFLLVISFAIKYRRRSEAEQPQPIEGSLRLELFWTIIPLGIAMVVFGWGANVYFTLATPPSAVLEIQVVAKQWMWKFQHPQGQREINELHVPMGRPVKLIMASEDVIHSFYVPAFRTKMDVVPGRYTTTWFEATRPGVYHLFCAEYCGTVHSGMIGRVVVLEPVRYEQWLSGPMQELPAMAGERLFQQLGCNTCHRDATGQGPSLAKVFGKPVSLRSGEIVIADEEYLRESILNPRAKIVAGYPPIMPTFQGQVTEEELLQLIHYIKSLNKEEGMRTP
jgi:cytochrome c oxidase subunit 2